MSVYNAVYVVGNGAFRVEADMQKRSTFQAVLIAVVATSVVWLLAGILLNARDTHDYASYSSIAEQHEQQKEWDLAKAAWLSARVNADAISNSTQEANGRKAYCDYRIGMNYAKEEQDELAIANLKLALATPASDIDSFMGRNGAKGMAEDLSDLIASSQSTEDNQN